MAEVAFDTGVSDALVAGVVVGAVRLVGVAEAVGFDAGRLDSVASGYRPR
jgi:hypothetical protein